MDGVAAAPDIVGRQRQRADARGRPSRWRARWRKKEPWPQSCWIMNRRTRKPAAGTARRGSASSRARVPPTSAPTSATNEAAVTTSSNVLLAWFGSRYRAEILIQSRGGVGVAKVCSLPKSRPFLGFTEVLAGGRRRGARPHRHHLSYVRNSRHFPTGASAHHRTKILSTFATYTPRHFVQRGLQTAR